ncbi:hypothetical protein BDB00DRAFT_876978 [Zychaea mexicana]|uniref:uncharacterized protein n=1 Tax=Zychaea mexicana TaxID=64656 RepID=UPI0022FEC1C0|nr:uncharacterized protein BDB00DRAFT_876978 [Zychaea mexicana]KAI9488913.1 hypothetical protein BDB00DRAFT_876978 [Zychaea mexicana]
MGPLVEMIGPILNGLYDPLPSSIQQFLDCHERVLYVAFGQHATAKPQEATRLLVELLQFLENGLIDGFLWATGRSIAGLPDTVMTASGHVYRVQDLRSLAKATTSGNDMYSANNHTVANHHDGQLLDWAPQLAILQHTAIITFLSHGGGMSLIEAFYTGKRTVIKPFFGINLHTYSFLSANNWEAALI